MQTQLSINKGNLSDVTVSITVTFKIHSEKYNFMEYWLGKTKKLESLRVKVLPRLLSYNQHKFMSKTISLII